MTKIQDGVALCATPTNKYSMSSDQHFPSTAMPSPSVSIKYSVCT